MAEPLVSNVSDTARWVAVYRGRESARPDALFHDPFADRLAGERGRAIAAAAPKEQQSGWAVVARTKLIDDLLLAAVADGCDTVLNLGAGLDTRPYRLAVPAGLSWIEADLPALVEEKEALLVGETPRCRLVREKVDLSDPAVLEAFLDRALAGSKKALVLTEAVLPYLEAPVVRSLGQALAARPALRWWVTDVMGPFVLSKVRERKGLQHANAPLRFAPAEGVAFFEPLGWTPRDVHSIFRAGVRYRRAPLLLRPLALLPDPNPRKPGKSFWSAIVRFERTGPAV